MSQRVDGSSYTSKADAFTKLNLHKLYALWEKEGLSVPGYIEATQLGINDYHVCIKKLSSALEKYPDAGSALKKDFDDNYIPILILFDTNDGKHLLAYPMSIINKPKTY